MKKRWLLTGLFALALCVCAASAQAAVTSGGVEYVWYTDAGRGEYNENNQFVSYEGHQFYLSADQGGSYAVLPGLNETQKQTGFSYALTVEATENGGLSVKGRDIWSTEYTWFREYSAQEIAAALEKPTKVTPVRVHATNGTVTVGSRYVMDYGNDDPTQPGSTGTNLLNGAYAGDRIVYSTDGVTWLPAEGECKLNWLGSIWWDGKAFYGGYDGTLTSADGIHWTKTEEEHTDPTFSRICELGSYRFEYAENAAGEWGVYLMDRTDPERGVLLPHMGEAARAKGVSIGKLRAWYGPNDTVILAAYDVYMKEKMMVSIDYPISSLDWCLENLKTQFRYINFQADNGEGVGLGMAAPGRYSYEGELVRREGSDIQWVRTPFRQIQRIYPYNGKTFVVWGDGKLYASEDGLSWTCLEGKGLGDEWDRKLYSFVWTGDRYISCRRTVQYSAGRAGTWGERYDPACTRVSFLNENFETIASYDFGRQVEAVGYLDGVYYARVSDCQSVSTNDYEVTQGILYRSADGKEWTAMPRYYTAEREDLLVSQRGAYSQVYHPTGDINKPQRSIAQLDRWRFVMDEVVERAWSLDAPELRSYRVYLMGDTAADWVELPHLGEAIKAQGINAWELTAAYNPDGTVEVRVTDKDDTSKYISISYPASSLDWVKENLMGTNGRGLPAYMGTNNDAWDIESKYGVADLIAVELANGENELVYRTDATGGHWNYFDSVPWGNEIELLEFSGKDFMVLDKADGKLYLSSDGVNWHEATGEWYKAKQQTYFRGWTEEMSGTLVSAKLSEGESGCCTARYAMKWVGDKYMAVCFWQRPSFTVATKVVWIFPNDPDMAKVLYLDEELNLIGFHDFGYMMTEVGFQDEVYFALTDGHIYKYGDFSIRESERLFISTDGENWRESDLLSVQDCMVKLQ